MGDPLDFAIVTALVLAAVQISGPEIRSLLGRHGRQVQSFGGGVGLAYVFLQLFPEIDNVHAWLGDHVHIVTLASFLMFFALEAVLILRARTRMATVQSRSEREEQGETTAATLFWLHIGITVFYISMVVFTLPQDIAEDFVFAAASGLAIGIHCVYKDYVLRSHVDERFQTTGRVLLAIAPLLGWLAHRIFEPSEVVLDLFVAVLAGVLMQSVFRDEIPRPDVASIGWVMAGVATFAALSLIS